MTETTEPAPKPKPKHSCRCLVINVFLGCLFLSIAGLSVLLGTESGFQLLVHSADRFAGKYFSAGQVKGRLLDQWQINKLQVHIQGAVDISLDTLAFHWQPFALFNSKELHIREIMAQGLVVRILDSGSQKKENKEQQTKQRITLPKIHLPLDLRIDKLSVTKSKIVASDGTDALRIHELLAQVAVHDDQGEITRLKADTSQFGCDLRGKIQFHGSWPMQAEGDWQVPDHGINELHGTVKVLGDFDKAAVEATMSSPAQVTLHGQVTDILNNLQWQARAETGHFHLHDIKVDVPVDGNLRIIQAAGTVRNYAGVLAADIHYEGYPPVQAEAKVIAKDYSGLKIEYLTVHHEDTELTTRGEMTWHGGFSWQAALESKNLDPSLLAADWPGSISGLIHSNGHLSFGKQELTIELDDIQGRLRDRPFALSGKLNLADKTLNIDELRLDSGATKLRVHGTAAADQRIDLSLQAETEDLGAFLPEYNGKGKIVGTALGTFEQAALQFHVNGSQLTMQGRSLPNLQADLNADLSLAASKSNLTVHDLQVLADGKSALHVQGQLGWKNGLSWQATLKAADLDPSLMSPDWPGKIDAELQSQGSKSADHLTVNLQIDKLAGKLRGFPLKGSGNATLNDQALLVDDVQLQSGSTFVRATGKADLHQKMSVTFKAGSENLSSLVPGAGGSFQAEGEVSGTLQQPSLHFQAKGSQLRFQDYALKKLKTTITADLSPAGQVDGEMSAAGIRIQQETIDTVQVRLKGGTEQHQLDLAAKSKRGSLQLNVAGGWKEQQWLGQVRKLELANKQFGRWTTKKAADLTLAADHCALADFAIGQDRVRAAVSGQWQQQEGWKAQVQLEHLALDLANKWQIPLPENFPKMQGEVTINAAAQGKGAIPQQAELTVALPLLALTAEDYESEQENGTTTWRWQDNQIKATLRDDRLHLQAKSQFQDKSTALLVADLSNCGDFSKPEHMPLSGQFKLQVMDISPMTQLSSYLVQGQGGFGGLISLHGTAAHPRLDGVLALKKGIHGTGKIHIAAAGINLQELRLAVAGDGSHNQFDLTTTSGQGSLRAQGTISRQPKQPIEAEFNITGKNFQAANLPEYQALVSPTLRLFHNGKGTVLTGTIVIPQARIAPLGFGGAASSSSDVVIVDSGDAPPEKGLPFSAAITLELGQEVAVDTFGVKGFLDGSLNVNAKANRPITALGSLSLRDTSVAFEGVSLQLSEGRIFYQGGPIDNPGLDIRASRTVNNVEAGIHLTGSADDMNIKLFSDTPMEDSTILSWLLAGQNGVSANRTGDAALSPAAAALSKIGGGALLKSVNPLNVLDMEDFVDVSIGGGKQASDVSLVMSKEIYKDLYISYGKDLTGEGGSFKARYDLGHGFSVESETSSKTTGADLLWSLEK